MKVTQPHESGFVLRHARAAVNGTVPTHYIKFVGRLEAEFVPQFQLLDAYVAMIAPLPYQGALQLNVGQHFAPFSRQTRLSSAEFQFVAPAQLTTLTPGRQIGATLKFNLPKVPWLEVSGGIFNGEGPNAIENIDSNFMYVARVAYKPINPYARDIESAIGEDHVAIAANYSWQKKDLGDYREKTTLVGGDAFVSLKGFSAYVEFLWGQVTYTAGSPKLNHNLWGFNGQAGYLLPIPGRFFRRFEVVARFEAVAPDDVVPLTGPGDPTQARASYVAGLNYYHRGHSIKLMLAYYHNEELDDRDATGKKASYDNDSVILQLTYRLE